MEIIIALRPPKNAWPKGDQKLFVLQWGANFDTGIKGNSYRDFWQQK
jgi:hypothetical protein